MLKVLLVNVRRYPAVADPDLELGGGGGAGLDLLALSAIFPSVISSFFTQNRGGGGPPGPLPLIRHCPVETLGTNRLLS